MSAGRSVPPSGPTVARAHAARRRLVVRVLPGRRGEGAALDTNVTSYVANGVWHHYLSTRDPGFLEEMFPVVERAIDFALDNQHSTGEIEWDADPTRVEGKGALLTGSSSIYSSLRCAIAAAERLGASAPTGSSRSDRSPSPSLTARSASSTRNAGRWTGTTRSSAAYCVGAPPKHASPSKWDVFVAPGRGVRCVSDQPWVTAAETCELVMALDAIGLHDRANHCSAGCSSCVTTTARTGPA